MNRLLLLFLLLHQLAYAQPDTTLNHIETRGDWGAANWRFQPGDDTAWANPTYPDARWQKGIGPATTFGENEGLWKAGKGWFRMRFRLDSALSQKPNTIYISQMGRSDWYLDGKQMASLGALSTDTVGNQLGYFFVPLPVTDTLPHTIAVRYQFRRDPIVTPFFGEEPISYELKNSHQAGWELVNSRLGKYSIDFITGGIFAILSLIHFLFYRANKSQRLNYLLGWMMLFFSLNSIDTLCIKADTLTMYTLLKLLADIASTIAVILLLTAVYAYLGIRRGWQYYLAIGLTVLYDGISLFSTDIPWYYSAITVVAYLGDYLRVSLIGRKRGDADAKLPWQSIRFAIRSILAGLLVLIILLAINSLYRRQYGGGDTAFQEIASVLFGMLGLLGILSIPLGLSLSLVRDYARTYLMLQTKLTEVEALSAQTVAQEQEKQAILTRQNERLEQQVAERTAALNQSLVDLKMTQNQLIQREKLASLGELTAGVAHEIQNPLNFVNNFSEVSVELVNELREERQKGPERDEALEDELIDDLEQNLQKISHHGHRAASIVLGMLAHSRTGSSDHVPTDLNALCDEYLKLAYHGLRRSAVSATDKTFEVTLETHFAPDLPPVTLAPTEMGRVLMNLCTNAFHAVRQRTQEARQQGIAGYVPTVWLITEQADGQVRIRVRDNGPGIPEAIQAKIFQPFFTTKPTGQGTGLGLSICYDIVTKGHGGTLQVRSAVGEGAEFVVAVKG
jgi:two-component system, NtrC family, sensor kinase